MDFAVTKEIVGVAQASGTAKQGQPSTDSTTEAEAPRAEAAKRDKQPAGASTNGGPGHKLSTGTAPSQDSSQREIISLVVEGEDEEDAKPATSKSTNHKRKGILRPRNSQASKKFMSRKESLRSAKQGQTTPNEDVEGDSDDSAHDLAEPPFPPQDPNESTPMVKNSVVDNWRGDADTTVVDQPLPSYYEPRGPGDTWTCPYDGCNLKVWEARTPASVAMIKEHFGKTHAGQAETLVNQESRPWVSVK